MASIAVVTSKDVVMANAVKSAGRTSEGLICSSTVATCEV